MQAAIITANGTTNIGQVRSTNQDSFLIEEKTHLYIVADGMGGHAGGEIASRLCTEKISEYIANHDEAFILERNKDFPAPEALVTVAEAVNFASSKIYEASLEDPSLRGMGTTATLVKIVGNHAIYAHVGDSRLYLLRAGFLYQITFDHSLVSEQVRAGVITAEEAENHHLKNVITRSVGYQEEEDVDTGSFLLEQHDKLFLCSDGLHGKVGDCEISKATESLGLDAVANLVDLANDRGGDDNITALIVHIDRLRENES